MSKIDVARQPYPHKAIDVSIPPSTFSGAVIGGIVFGLFIGPIGAAVGFIGGGLLGSQLDRQDARRATESR